MGRRSWPKGAYGDFFGFFVLLFFQSTWAALNSPAPIIYIQQWVRHPALDETVRGIREGLKQKGFIEGENIEMHCDIAQGDMGLARQMAEKVMTKSPRVSVAVGTSSAQILSTFARRGQTSLIFSSVTDPEGANLMPDPKNPQYRISGVSNFFPLENSLRLFKKILPSLSCLGVVYNGSEVNSKSLVSHLKRICPGFGITLKEAQALHTRDVLQSVNALIGKGAQAIFISNDNTALAGLPAIIAQSQKAKVPVFVGDTDALCLGALAALGPNQYDIGLQTAEQIVKILKGQKEIPGKNSVEYPKKVKLFLNKKQSEYLNIPFSPQLLQEADAVL